jgi:hypothetical protein
MRIPAELVGIDRDAESFLDGGGGAFEIDDQAVGIAIRDFQALAFCPVKNGLLVLRSWCESRVPFVGGQKLVELRRTFGVQLLQKFFFLGKMGWL